MHIFGHDCAEWSVLILLIVATIAIKLYQNKVWADMAQAQRAALQVSVDKRGAKVWELVKMEAISTTLGLVSIILILGYNGWVMIAIVVGNLWGVHRTYSKLTKDSHSTAHDLVDMLQGYQKGNNSNAAEFVMLLKDVLKEPDVKQLSNIQLPGYQKYTDREIKF